MKFILRQLLLALAFITACQSCRHSKEQSKTTLKFERDGIPQSTNSSRFLFEEYYLPIRITNDVTNLSGLAPTTMAEINNLISIVGQIFSDTLSVKRRQSNLFFPWSDQGLNCGGITVLSADTTTGILNSDLHIYYNFEFDSTDSWFASGVACALQNGDNRPVFGRITINLAQLSIGTSASFNKYIQLLAHQFVHILGFSQWLFQYWKDENGNPYDSSMFTDNYNVFQSETNSIISTPNLLKAVRDHFDCQNLEGVPLENGGDQYSQMNHFEANLFHDDLMTAISLTPKQVLSIFDFALLKDTGWYSITGWSTSNFEQTIWGKGKGCDFIFLECSSSKNFNEFCQTQNTVGCDAQFMAKSSCQSVSPYSSSCYYQQQQVDCTDSNQNNFLSLSSEVNAVNSRCLASTLITTSASAKTTVAACYNSICQLGGTQIQITIGATFITCTTNNQVLTVVGYSGTLICPSDILQFCSIQSNQCSDCSMKGYCYLGVCHCLTGYIGNNCECRIIDQFRYVSGLFVTGSQAYCVAIINSAYCLSIPQVPCTLCKPGYYIAAATYCLVCPPNCLTCSSSVVCNTCASNYYLTSTNTCVSSCPIQSFANDATQQCSPCSSAQCKTCPLNICIECLSTAFTTKISGSSVVTCSLACTAITQYSNSKNQCFSCDAACVSGCYASSSSECLSGVVCAIGFIATSTGCVATPGVCQYPITSSTNVSCCPITQFQVSSSYCVKCNNSFSSLNFIIVQERICVNNCSNGYYLVTPSDYSTKQVAYCLACNAKCYSCSGPLSTDCITCVEGLYYYLNSCITQCPNNTYVQTTTSISSSDSQQHSFSSCQQCHASCLSCDGPLSSNCTNCGISYTLQDDNSCVPKCPLTSYFDNLSYQCQTCQSHCQQCTSTIVCLLCTSGYFFHAPTSTCVSQCPYGYLADATSRLCQTCHSSCETCSVPNDQNSCTTCVVSLKWSYGKCVTACQSNQFSISTTDSSGNIYNFCKYCHFSCASCSGVTANDCILCADFFFKLNTTPQTCVQFCPDDQHYLKLVVVGLYTCQACQCLKCSETGQCLQCVTGEYLYNGVCVTTCPSAGYFTDYDNNTCTSCHPTCSECENDSEYGCKVCLAGYQLVLGNQCQSIMTCALNYFFNGLECVQCILNCKICFSDRTCSSCSDGYSYDSSQQKCLQRVALVCPQGYYYESGIEYTCLKCQDNCYECTSYNTCLVYRASCHYTCQDCIGNNEYSCITCTQNRYISNYIETPLSGECRCKSGYSDFGVSICKSSSAEESQIIASITTQSIQLISSLSVSLITRCVNYFIFSTELSQFIGQLSYLNKHNQVGMDHTLTPFRAHSLNILLPATFRHSQNSTSNRFLAANYSSTDTRSRQLTKLEAIHGSSNFIISCFAIIILVVVVFIIWLICFISTYTSNKNKIIMPQKYMDKTERFSEFKQYMKISIPLQLYSICLQEISICIFTQYQLFGYAKATDSFKIIGLTLAIIFNILIVICFYIELKVLPNIDSTVNIYAHIYYFHINKQATLSSRYIGLNNFRKCYYSLLIVFDYNNPLTIISLMIFTEILFAAYVMAFKPYKKKKLNLIIASIRMASAFVGIIMAIMVNSKEISNEQVNCVFVLVVISNAISLLYSIIYLTIAYIQQKKNSILSSILPKHTQQIPVKSIVDLQLVKTQYHNINTTQVNDNKLDLAIQNNTIFEEQDEYSVSQKVKVKLPVLKEDNQKNASIFTNNKDKVEDIDNLDSASDNSKALKNPKQIQLVTPSNQSARPIIELQQLNNSQANANVNNNNNKVNSTVEDYGTRKKALASLNRSKLIGYNGLKKEIDDSLANQQKALLELQLQGERERNEKEEQKQIAIENQIINKTILNNKEAYKSNLPRLQPIQTNKIPPPSIPPVSQPIQSQGGVQQQQQILQFQQKQSTQIPLQNQQPQSEDSLRNEQQQQQQQQQSQQGNYIQSNQEKQQNLDQENDNAFEFGEKPAKQKKFFKKANNN